MKRYAMEFVGTFFLTVAIILTANPITIGLMLMAMIYVGGHVSGAHFNPAITIALACVGDFSWAQVPMYVVAQFIGAFIGAALVLVSYYHHFKIESC